MGLPLTRRAAQPLRNAEAFPACQGSPRTDNRKSRMVSAVDRSLSRSKGDALRPWGDSAPRHWRAGRRSRFRRRASPACQWTRKNGDDLL